jgi:hypothetical protein
MSTLTTDLLPARSAAIAAAVGFLTIAAFQLALALGAPLGRAAWGGTHAQLPTGLRVANAFAAGVWALAALIILQRAGIQAPPLPSALARVGTWILIGVLAIGAVMNFASPSGWERYLWGPVAVIMAGLCLLVARSAATASGG